MEKLFHVLILLLTSIILSFSSAAADESTSQSQLKDITVAQDVDLTTVTIKTDRPVSFSSYQMPELWKGVIDLPYVTLGTDEFVKNLTSGPVKRVVARPKTVNGVPVVRIAFDLTMETDMTVEADLVDKSRVIAKLRPRKQMDKSKPVVSASEKELSETAKPEKDLLKVKPLLQPIVVSKLQARNLTDVKIGEDKVEIVADGWLENAKVFALKKPNRLVIDMPGIETAIKGVRHANNRLGAKAYRLGKFEGRMRLVFDFGDKEIPTYRVDRIAKGLIISPSAIR